LGKNFRKPQGFFLTHTVEVVLFVVAQSCESLWLVSQILVRVTTLVTRNYL